MYQACVACLQCDVRDRDGVMSMCAGVDCVYHMASFGMSGREQVREQVR